MTHHDNPIDTLSPLPGMNVSPTGRRVEVDVAAYEHFLEGADLTEDEKREIIEALWSIIVSFVDLGFGVHPVQQIDAAGDKTCTDPDDQLQSKHQSFQTDETTPTRGVPAETREEHDHRSNTKRVGALADCRDLLPRVRCQTGSRRRRSGKPGSAVPRVCTIQRLRRAGGLSR